MPRLTLAAWRPCVSSLGGECQSSAVAGALVTDMPGWADHRVNMRSRHDARPGGGLLLVPLPAQNFLLPLTGPILVGVLGA
ncbi:hypothetical protein SCALM49S_03969 [Streptomyces californicus]